MDNSQSASFNSGEAKGHAEEQSRGMLQRAQETAQSAAQAVQNAAHSATQSVQESGHQMQLKAEETVDSTKNASNSN